MARMSQCFPLFPIRFSRAIVLLLAALCAVRCANAQYTYTPLLSGGVGFFTSTNGGNTTYQPHIEPLVAAPITHHLLIESRGILLENFFPNGPSGYDHSHLASFIYLQGDYLV